MAEGLLRFLYGNRYEVYSAGTKPTSVNPYAIKVMREIGVDISSHRSKSLNEFKGVKFDYVVTVCDRARESCPIFPSGARRLHRGFEDPDKVVGTEEEKIAAFRRVRDEIKGWIMKTFGAAEENP